MYFLQHWVAGYILIYQLVFQNNLLFLDISAISLIMAPLKEFCFLNYSAMLHQLGVFQSKHIYLPSKCNHIIELIYHSHYIHN